MDSLAERIDEIQEKLSDNYHEAWFIWRRIEKIAGRVAQLRLYKQLKKIGEFNNVYDTVYERGKNTGSNK